MKCVVVFCHAVAQELVCDVLEREGCRHYVGVGRAFARDDDERRFDSRYHPDPTSSSWRSCPRKASPTSRRPSAL